MKRATPVRRSAMELLETRRLLSLVIDLRLAGGGKDVTVDSVGDTVALEAWAIVSGTNASLSDEGVQIVVGSFLSTDIAGGSVRGDLSLTRAAPFDGHGSSVGNLVDLDGDGDLDIGSNIDSSANGFYSARSNTMTTGGTPAAGGGVEFKLANLTFTVTSLLAGSSTQLNFRTRSAGQATGLFLEDGQLKSPINGATYSASTPVIVFGSGPTDNLGSISGTVFNDTNSNGVLNSGEAELGGWTVFLDNDNDSILDASEPFASTDTGGNYTFVGLPAGTYHVAQVLGAGYQPINPADGSSDVNLAAGEDRLHVNFANGVPAVPRARITGVVINDTDGDGVHDLNELGLPKWRVYIDANKNGLLDSGEVFTDTDEHGNYAFTNLVPGNTYRVRELLYAGFRRVTPSSGYYDVTPTAGQTAGGSNFLNTKLALISGSVFKDTNGNGKRDAGEVGLAGWRVWDDIDNDGALDVNEKSVLTDSKGNYSLNVGAGWHYIRVQQKAGHARTTALYHKILVGESTRVYDKLFGYKPIA